MAPMAPRPISYTYRMTADHSRKIVFLSREPVYDTAASSPSASASASASVSPSTGNANDANHHTDNPNESTDISSSSSSSSSSSHNGSPNASANTNNASENTIATTTTNAPDAQISSALSATDSDIDEAIDTPCGTSDDEDGRLYDLVQAHGRATEHVRDLRAALERWRSETERLATAKSLAKTRTDHEANKCQNMGREASNDPARFHPEMGCHGIGADVVDRGKE
ncbi:hypothetical protein BKA81DRAFT_434005 [Phyllosticta paracitricarpa]